MNTQNPQPYTQWGLPPGAKTRIGKGVIGSIRYSPDGTQLAVTGPVGVWLYDTHAHTERALLRPWQQHGTASLPFSWSGTRIVCVNWDGTISLWDTHVGERRISSVEHTEDDVWAVVLSPDGTTLVTAGWDKKIRFWDSHTSRLRFAAVGHTGSISTLAFSPDGRTLASGGDDQTIRLWDAHNCAQRAYHYG